MKVTLLLLLGLLATPLFAQVQPCLLTAEVNIDNVPIGDSAAKDLTIKNLCGHDAVLTSYDSSVVERYAGRNGQYFKFVNFPYGRTVAPGDSVAFTIWYFPQENGVRNCLDVRIYSDSPSGSIVVCGSGANTTTVEERPQVPQDVEISIDVDAVGAPRLITITSLSNDDELLELRVVDLLGHCVFRESLSGSAIQTEAHVDIDPTGIRAGMYFAVVASTRGIVGQPFIVP